MNQMQSDFRSLRKTAARSYFGLNDEQNEAGHPMSDPFNRFWNVLETCLGSGTFAEMDPVIESWSASHSDGSTLYPENNISSTVNGIFREIWKTIDSELNSHKSSELFSALLPLVTYANEKILLLETKRATDSVKAILQETQSDLEIIERNKSKFIRIAAHELKTPLTIINGYTAMLSEMLTADQTGISEMVRGIEAGTERLRVIVQDLIDVSLIDNRLLNFTIQPVWLNRLFENLLSEFIETIEKRKQTFNLHPFEGMDEMFYSDPERLMQLFRNLVSNAIKYTPDGGQINLNGRKLPGFIEVIVSDNGIGIAPENHALIFEKFIQLGETSRHSSSKTSYMGGGPGLGLHITKGIVEAMGGTIWVESPGFDEKKYPGSSFHVLLPVDQKSMKNNLHEFLQN